MDLYYGNRVRKSIITWRVIPYIVSLLIASTLLLSLLAPYDKPEGGVLGWLLPIAALYAPYTYAANLVVALLWMVARRRFAIPLLALSIIATFNIDRYYNILIIAGLPQSSGGVTITMQNCEGLETIDYQGDIITLQRFKGEIDLEKYNQHRYGELFTLSRYPIAGRDSLDNMAQITDLIYRGDTIRIINAQLQRSLITDSEYDDEQMSLWFREYGERSSLRALEAERIDSLVRYSPYKVIVTVAMEDVAQSYTYNILTENLTDSYMDNKYLHSQHNNYIRGREQHRLGYIFTSDGIEPLNYSDSESESDHRKITLYAKIKR
ncbi:MAG: hypothetical protein SNG35_00750 [Rikenellaceae bacterium]